MKVHLCAHEPDVVHVEVGTAGRSRVSQLSDRLARLNDGSGADDDGAAREVRVGSIFPGRMLDDDAVAILVFSTHGKVVQAAAENATNRA